MAATVIYIITLILALLLAIPFRSMLNKIAGNSMSIESMIKGFDFTTYSDFLRSAGHAVYPFITSAVLIGILYFVFTVFFAGGILKFLNDENLKFSAGIFFENCAVYFFRFLRLAVYILILQLIFAFIIFVPLGMVLAFVSDSVQNESAFFYIVLTCLIVYLFFFLLVLIIGDYAKIILFVNDSRKSLKSVWSAVKFVFKHFISTYLLYLLLLVAPLLLFALYFYLDNVIGAVSALTILIMFLIQQVLVWLRTWIKIWFLGSELSLYGLFPFIQAEYSAKKTVRAQQNSGDILPDTPE